MPIVQMMTLRPKDFKPLAQVAQPMHGRVGTPSQASGSPSRSMLLDTLPWRHARSPRGNAVRGPSARTHPWRVLVTAQAPVLGVGGGLSAPIDNEAAGGPTGSSQAEDHLLLRALLSFRHTRVPAGAHARKSPEFLRSPRGPLELQVPAARKTSQSCEIPGAIALDDQLAPPGFEAGL